ncbi:MAG: SDR family oxidoreductase [Brevundimonas sp.]
MATETRPAILVSGASRGLGRQLVESFSVRGDLVVGLARSASTFDHPNYIHHQADVTIEAEVKAVMAALAGHGLHLETCINNAGIAAGGLALMTSANTFSDVLTANLVSAFVVSRESLKLMKRRKFGRIINMSSINVPLASAGGSAYNASKAGVEAMARTLVNEISAHEDITINTLGLSIVAGSGMAEALSATAAAAKTAHLPRPALLQIEEIVHAIDFLRSPSARNFSGQTLYFGGVG